MNSEFIEMFLPGRTVTRIALSTCLLGFSLSGCGSTRNQGSESLKDPTIIRQIVIGQSTKSDVQNLLGPAQRISQGSEGESWQYSRFAYDGTGNAIGAVGGAALAFIPFAGGIAAGAVSASGAGGQKSTEAGVIVRFDQHDIVSGCTANFAGSGTGITGAGANAPHDPIACSVKSPPPQQVAAVAAPSLKTYTAVGNLNVRKTPARDGVIISQLANGAVVTGTSQVSGDWVEIQIDGSNTGWVFGKNLK